MSRHQKSVVETPRSRGARCASHRGARARSNKSDSPAKSPKPTKPWEAVRKDKLLRAKKLLEDAEYPSDEVIESVAKLLARNWRRLRKVADHSSG